jgi:hypothetical protein
MASSLTTLAAGHAAAHSTIPSPLTIVLVVAAVGWMLWSRMKGQPLKVRRLLVLPVVLTVLGITDLTGSSAPHLTAKDIGFLATGAAISAVLGAARGATIVIYPQAGELWQRYRPVTVGLWITLIATKLILMVIAGAAHASAGGGTSSLLLTLGISLLAEAAIVGPRALSTGLPFATDHEDSASGHRSRSGNLSRELTPSHDERGQDGTQPRTSPRVSDGISWLRQQAGQPAQTWSQHNPSPVPAGDGRDSHHQHDHDHDSHHQHDHDQHHHGLTGPS